MELCLKSITKENWHECVGLSVYEGQKGYVASNAFSLAQSKYEPEMVPAAIYCQDSMVGFAMYAKEPDTGRIWIVRLMIDKNCQAKGYGKAALAKLMDSLPQIYNVKEIYLSVEKENEVAIRMYEGFGFRPTGEVEEGELVYRVDLA